MNSTPEGVNGGVTIRPMPRKSIHSHRSECPSLLNENMVRYGIYSHNKKHQHHGNEDSQANQGTDVVDNSMSKFAYTSSPILERKNDYLRRSSVDIPNDKYSSDSDDDIKLLSKSSPAFFSSLYCSDESYNSNNQNERDISGDSSRTSAVAASSTINRYNSRENSLNQSQNVSQGQSPQKLNNQSEQSTLKYIVIVLVILIAAGAALSNDYFNDSIGIRNNVYDEFSFYNDVKSLGEKYKVNDNSMLQIRTGIATIFEKQDSGSFIFAYNSQANRFNIMVFNDFMKEISATAARYLRNETETGHHVVVDTSNIKTDTELMNLYREDVDRTGVMLVKELNDIPSQLAMAFHYYCDEYNPLVKRSAIFFTMNLASCTNASNGGKSTHKYIEKCLATKWHNVQEDKIGPLLTRVVNIVVDVTSIF